jgi:hypothetical protein
MGNDVTSVTQHNLAELRHWCERYLAADLSLDELRALIELLDQDITDSKQIEQQIEQHVSRLQDFEYYCDECRERFDNWNWPDSAQTCVRTFDNTIALEAAARKGCRFCCFILHTLVDADMLQTFRRIEARLNVLGECEKFKVLQLRSQDTQIGLPARANILHNLWSNSLRLTYLNPTGE